MRNDEIERLLGGYATGTLTDNERKVLYDAALDDQELFNALEDEEALRDLLADTDSRREIERALRQPEPKKPWFGRPWVWGLAGSLAMACAVFVFMVPRHAEVKPGKVVARVEEPNFNLVAPAQPAPNSPAQPKRTRLAQGQLRARLETSRIPAAAPQADALNSDGQILGLQRAVPASSSSFASAMKVTAGPLPVTIVRGESVVQPADTIQAGDTVRLRVVAPFSGVLTISSHDEAGANTPLGQPLQVLAGQQYTVPQTPLTINAPSTIQIIVSGPDVLLRAAMITIAPGQPAVTR